MDDEGDIIDSEEEEAIKRQMEEEEEAEQADDLDAGDMGGSALPPGLIRIHLASSASFRTLIGVMCIVGSLWNLAESRSGT